LILLAWREGIPHSLIIPKAVAIRVTGPTFPIFGLGVAAIRTTTATMIARIARQKRSATKRSSHA
jgi:hypothetical protein